MKLVFKTIEEVRAYVPRLTLTVFGSISDYVDNATVRSVAPHLGKLYDTLADYLDGVEQKNEELNRLKPYVQRAVAYYAVFNFVRAGGVLITAGGTQKTETDTHKSSSYADKMDTANYYAENADAAMDALLTFIEEHKAEYPDYEDKTPTLLIRSATVYNGFVNIGSSRRTYLALIAEMRNVELFYLKPLLGIELLNKLRDYAAEHPQPPKGDYNDSGQQEKDLQLLQCAQAVAANMSMARAIPMLTLRNNEGAIGVASFYSPSQAERQALKEVLNQLRDDYERTAKTYLDELENLLRTEDSSGHLLTNSKDSKHFVTPYIS